MARQEVFSQVCLEAHVQDDGHIDSIKFIIDGLSSPDRDLILVNPPYQVLWNTANITPGSHHIQAQAWDNAGHTGLSSWIMINKISDEPVVTRDTLFYYNHASDGDIAWLLPDERLSVDADRYTGYGTRFTMSYPAILRKIWVRIHRDETWSGIEWTFEIRSSHDGLPDSLIYSSEFDGLDIPLDMEGNLVKMPRIRLSGEIHVPTEFFILAMLSEETTGDTLAIMSDDGLWRNWHGVVRQNGQWREFTAGLMVAFNPMIKITVDYEY